MFLWAMFLLKVTVLKVEFFPKISQMGCSFKFTLLDTQTQTTPAGIARDAGKRGIEHGNLAQSMCAPGTIDARWVAVGTAHPAGWTAFLLDSDPNAAPRWPSPALAANPLFCTPARGRTSHVPDGRG
jgi:hypothetical protein